MGGAGQVKMRGRTHANPREPSGQSDASGSGCRVGYEEFAGRSARPSDVLAAPLLTIRAVQSNLL